MADRWPVYRLPHPAADWDWRPDAREWTEMAHVALVDLGSGLLTTTPRDIADYCPSYQRLNDESRRAFWVYLLSRLARIESNPDPGMNFTQSFNGSQGNPVISRGLLQISKESANGYGCRIVDADELHDPEVDIRYRFKVSACGLVLNETWSTNGSCPRQSAAQLPCPVHGWPWTVGTCVRLDLSSVPVFQLSGPRQHRGVERRPPLQHHLALRRSRNCTC